MKKTKLITKFSILSLLIDAYSNEFSSESFTEINPDEIEEVMEIALGQINEQIEIQRENASEEELNILQEKADNAVREEMERLISSLLNEVKSEIK